MEELSRGLAQATKTALDKVDQDGKQYTDAQVSLLNSSIEDLNKLLKTKGGAEELAKVVNALAELDTDENGSILDNINALINEYGVIANEAKTLANEAQSHSVGVAQDLATFKTATSSALVALNEKVANHEARIVLLEEYKTANQSETSSIKSRLTALEDDDAKLTRVIQEITDRIAQNNVRFREGITSGIAIAKGILGVS